LLKKNLKYKIFIPVLLCFFISNMFFLPILAADTSGDELEKIKSEKEETQKKIEDIKKKESEYIREVNDTEEDLLAALDELNDLNSSIADKKSAIDQMTVNLIAKEGEIRAIEEKLEEKLEVFNDRIVSIYKNNDKNILDVFLKSEEFIEFISRLKLMNLIAKQDAWAISKIKKDRKLLIDSKKEILDLRESEEKEKKDLESLLARLELKKSEIENIYNKKKELLSVTQSNKNALMAMENQLEAREKEITRTLQGYSHGVAPAGKLLWPVAGKLSSGFGYRTSYSGSRRFHAGVDLYAPMGTPIYACEAGQVLKAEYHGGYGYSILIYHGGGMATFYAHLSGFAVAVGQNVSRGQLIGYVGTTGYTTGPHLHLEVRINGVAQNPMGYL
jgi:murein DD-endopeptidase MepM/ murein hydrolase activator NlpD